MISYNINRSKALRLSVIIAVVLALFIGSTFSVDASSTTTKVTKGAKLDTMKATWYTGSVLGFRGSGGKLTCSKSVAINAAQRQNWGVKYGQKIYLTFPGAHKKMNGWYEVKDSGCAYGIVDLFFANYASVPSKFRVSGVVNGVKAHKAKTVKVEAKKTKTKRATKVSTAKGLLTKSITAAASK